MASQQNFGAMGGAFNVDFRDPVFEPSTDFHFEDDSNQMMPDAFGQQADFAL